MDPEDFDPLEAFKMIMGQKQQRDPNEGKDYDPKGMAEAAEKLNTPKLKKLEVGDRLIWKPGMKNRVFPPYGVPIIVTRILSEMERLAIIEGRTAKDGTGFPVEFPDFIGVVALNASTPNKPGDDEPYPMEYLFDSRFWDQVG
jgi:hypothetical protein